MNNQINQNGINLPAENVINVVKAIVKQKMLIEQLENDIPFHFDMQRNEVISSAQSFYDGMMNFAKALGLKVAISKNQHGYSVSLTNQDKEETVQTKELKIDGCVSVPINLSEAEFTNRFLDFIGQSNWSFGGGINNVEGEKNKIVINNDRYGIWT